MSATNEGLSEKEMLGTLYLRYDRRLGAMLGDSAFADKLFEVVETFVSTHSPWLECSSTVRKVMEGGPDHSKVTFDEKFVPTVTYNGHCA